ncbi:MAG TPA: hypothetical protein VIP48_23265 [Streptosporangiaceae bacterium]
MPLPQVSDRIKELPGQALRAVFTGVGQLLLAADKVRAQLATPVDDQAQPPATAAAAAAAPPAAAPPATAEPPTAAKPPAAGKTGSSVTAPEATDPAEARWRSLDKTGNVRVLHDGDPDLTRAASTPPAPAAEPAAAETEAESVAAEPMAAEPAEPVAADEPAPAGLSEPEPADLAVPSAAEVAEPEPADPAVPTSAEVAKPAPAEPVPAEPILAAQPEPAEVTATTEPTAVLPVTGYDELSVASLRARLRVLDVAQVRTLLDYEKAHQGRADVITMFERRITKLEQGG